MRKKTLFYLVFLPGLLMIFLNGCKKETIKVPPTVSLISVSAITSNSATSGGDVASDGGATVTDRGICFGIKPYPTTSDNKINNGTGLGGFTSSMTGLNPGVTYYVRAFATNSVKTSYSGQAIFVTIALAPVLTTIDLSAITSSSATSGGNITSDGGSSVMARGVCWNTTQNPTVADFKTTDGTGAGTFTSNITGLLPGTVYYIKAYATNGIGTVYGNQVTLTTSAVAPVLTTVAPTSVTSTTATSGGNITSDGGSAVTVRGVCWATTQNPTIANSKTADGTGSGTFASNLTSLLPVTTYYVKAYATNSIGTSYGNQFTVTTTAAVPTLSTSIATAVTSTTASSGGNITADGGSTVTTRGVCWATTQNPTTANSKTTDGTGPGTFTSNLTGLLPGTTYYVKAYATNSIGTTYGNQVTITTIPDVPVLTTTAASALASTTATSGGIISSDGGSSVTVRGVCWAMTQNPTTANSKTSDGSGSGTFISNITGLSSGRTYYVRAYATNGVGTSYGNQITFLSQGLVPETFTDVDANVYHAVVIGTQTWMVENLKTTRYRNGASIPNVTVNASWPTLVSGAYCWRNNDAASFKATYGALYNWYTVVDGRNIAPAGWHVPTIGEWNTLVNYLGGVTVAGGKLKESGTTHWTTPNSGATNSTGFTAVPGGTRNSDGTFFNFGTYGAWWISTEYSTTKAWYGFMYCNDSDADNYNDFKFLGFSVRCIRD